MHIATRRIAAAFRIAATFTLFLLATGALSAQPATGQTVGRVIESAGILGPTEITTGDIDGDGDDDIAVLAGDAYDAESPQILWFENQNDGFGPKQTIDAGLAERADDFQEFRLTDVTGSGRADLLLSGSTGLSYYRSNVGTADADVDGFGDRLVIETEDVDGPVAVAQLDGQAGPELVTSRGYYLNQIGTAGADADGFADAQGPEFRFPVAADFDEDGDIDIASGDRWYPNQFDESGTDGFGQPEELLRDSFYDLRTVAAYPIDGDSRPDIVAYSEDVLVWIRNQVGESGAIYPFGAPKTISNNGPRRSEARIGDFNGDGDVDIASAVEDDDDSSRRLAWFENQVGESGADTDGFGDATILLKNYEEFGGPTEDFAVGQLDGSGGADVTTAVSLGGWISVYSADGTADNGFGDENIVSSTGPIPRVRAVTSADFDGDGDPDAATASIAADQVAWHENQIGEAGADSDQFGPTQVISADEDSVVSLVSADVDGDGDPDLVSAAAGGGRVAWHENQIEQAGADEDGFASPKVLATSLNRPKSVFTGDIDGDGDPDVAVGTFGTSREAQNGRVLWFENQTGESGSDTDGFGPEQVIDSGLTGVEEITVSSLNSDSRPEVAVLAQDEQWYPNQLATSGADGDGFGKARVVGSDGYRNLYASDLNADGANDLLVYQAWYPNREAGPFPDRDGFGDAIRLGTSSGGAISAVDLDGDGDRDPLLASGSTVKWTLNTIVEGTALGESNPVQTVTDRLVRARDGTAADLDQDGDLDLLITDEGGSGLIWYDNRSAEGPTPSSQASKRISAKNTSTYGDTGVRIALRGTAGSGTVSVERFGAPPEDPQGIEETNVSRFRVVIENRGSLTIGEGTEVRFDADRFPGIDDPSTVRVYSRPGPGNGTFQPLPTEYDTDTGEIVASVSSFSEFVFASDANPLPLEVTSFAAQTSGDGSSVVLAWTTADESGVEAFDIQRRVSEGSSEGSWSTVDTKAAAGDSARTRTYQFVDEQLPFSADSLSYRLKAVGIEGRAGYSQAVTVRRGAPDDLRLLGTYPNPARSQATVQYAVPVESTVRLRLYDVLGRRVETVQSKRTPAGRSKLVIDVSDLSSGTYFLRLSAEGKTRTQKVTVVD
jgi:hypothetical protein